MTNPSDDWSKQRLHYAKQCRIKFLQSYLKPPIVLDSQKYEKQASSIDISDVGMSDRIKAWINHRFTSNMSKNLVIQIDQVHFRYEVCKLILSDTYKNGIGEKKITYLSFVTQKGLS